MKGAASSLALSLALNTSFRLHWHRNSRLEDYFDLEPLVLKDIGQGERLNLNNQRNNLLKYSKNLTSLTSNLKIHTNTIDGVQGILENPIFTNGNLPKIFPDFDIENDQSPFVASILRFVIGQPNAQLSRLYEECIESHLGDGNLLKVGMQIRNGDFGIVRFKEDKFDEFEAKILEDFPTEADREKVVVFVTGDSNDKFQSLIGKLRVNFQVVTSGETCQQLHFTHIGTHSGQWISEAKAYLDWYVLTRMDRLYISRSGFGETAALISMVPTQHFTCKSGEWKFQTFPILHPFEEVSTDNCWNQVSTSLSTTVYMPIHLETTLGHHPIRRSNTSLHILDNLTTGTIHAPHEMNAQ